MLWSPAAAVVQTTRCCRSAPCRCAFHQQEAPVCCCQLATRAQWAELCTTAAISAAGPQHGRRRTATRIATTGQARAQSTLRKRASCPAHNTRSCVANGAAAALHAHSILHALRHTDLRMQRTLTDTPRCSHSDLHGRRWTLYRISLSSASRRRLHSAVARRSTQPSAQPPLPPASIHLDASGHEVLELLRAHFPVAQMDMIAAYGSGAFVQIADSGAEATSASAVASTATPSSAPPAAADPSSNMLDLIFAVPDPLEFHRANMSRNPSHYSFLRWIAGCFPSIIHWVQESGAGVWYNTLIPLEIPATVAAASSSSAAVPSTRLIKYGVISRSRLVSDLEGWTDLYIAGRMHKPMHILVCSAEIQRAAKHNLQAACNTALLLIEAQREAVAEASAVAAAASSAAPAASSSPSAAASAVSPVAPPSPVSPRVVPLPSASLAPPSTSSPSVIPLRTLLRTIAALSYSGDVRMGLAENPHKVANIVAGSWNELVALYAPVIARVLRESCGASLAGSEDPKDSAATASKPTDVIDFDCDVSRRTRMLTALPAHFQEQILKSEAQHPPTHHLPVTSASKPDALPSLPPPTWRRIALLPAADRHLVLSTALSRIVRRSSSQQTVKGLATAGVRKSVQYALAKVRKAFRK